MRDFLDQFRTWVAWPWGRRALSYRAFVERAAGGMLLADAGTLRILDANPALLQRAGYSRAKIRTLKLPELFAATRSSDPSLQEQIQRAEGNTTFNWTEKRAAGAATTVTVYCDRIVDQGQQLLALIAYDTSQRSKSATPLTDEEQRLSYLAHHDQLTNLPNRHHLTAMLPLALADASAKGEMLAIMFIDLDHFKRVNDSRGHEVGDRLLQEVAKRIKAITRETDTVIRMGGDEFVIVLRHVTDTDQIAQTARRINSALDKPIVVDNFKLVTTASIGISLFPRDGADMGELLKYSDSAMYRAKEGGRNKFQMFLPEMNEKIKLRVALEAALRAAIKLNQFDVVYQPIIELRTSRVAGLEALVRWIHPQKGLVTPEHFLEVAEDSGLIVPIGNFVIRHVLEDLKTWRSAGLPLVPVSINISPGQLSQGDLANFIKKQLAANGFGPEALEIELTERAMFMAGNALHSEPRRDIVAELRESGISIAIDDFGTGYSSLSYLKRWHFDKLKIDRSFIRDLVTDPNDFAIVSAILAIARQLRVDVVAEGIEGYPQLQKLQPLGCRFGQGFLFARPQLPQDCHQFLKSSVPGDTAEVDLMADLAGDSGSHTVPAALRSQR